MNEISMYAMPERLTQIWDIHFLNESHFETFKLCRESGIEFHYYTYCSAECMELSEMRKKED